MLDDGGQRTGHGLGGAENCCLETIGKDAKSQHQGGENEVARDVFRDPAIVALQEREEHGGRRLGVMLVRRC